MLLQPTTSTEPDPGIAPTWRRTVGVLAVATIGIGVANYLLSLAALRLLPAASFSNFAAGQGLLVVLGTGSFAALPWAVARYLARSSEVDAAQKAMHFGLMGSAVQAAVLGPVAVAVCWSLDGPAFGLAGGVASILISLLSGPVGFLQGRGELGAIAALRSLETLARIAATLALIFLVSRSAAVALIGFPIGSAIALAYALRRCRSGFPVRRLPRSVASALTRDAALLGSIQVLLTMLGALDTVYADAGHFSANQTASYQAAALLARIPLFFSAAIATAAYTHLAAAPDEAEAGRQLRSALRTFGWLSAPFLVAYLTLPRPLLDLVVPARYDQTFSVLRILCFAGVVVGVINVLTTAHQARGVFRTCIGILMAGVAAQALALEWLGRAGNLIVFASAATLVGVATLGALVRDGRQWLLVPRTARRRTSPRWAPVLAVLAALVAALDRQPAVWLAVLAVVCVCAVQEAFRTAPSGPQTGRRGTTGRHARPTRSRPNRTTPTVAHVLISPEPLTRPNPSTPYPEELSR